MRGSNWRPTMDTATPPSCTICRTVSTYLADASKHGPYGSTAGFNDNQGRKTNGARRQATHPSTGCRRRGPPVAYLQYFRNQFLKNIGYKTFDALWLCSHDGVLLHIVVVATDTGGIAYRVFFATNVLLGIPEIIADYGSRWSIEHLFRDIK